MQLDGCGKGDEEHELVVHVAFHPVLFALGGLALAERRGRRRLEQRAHSAKVAVGIEKVQPAHVDHVGDIRVAAWQAGARPCTASTAATGAVEPIALVLGLGGERLDCFRELLRIRARVLPYLLVVLVDDECGGAGGGQIVS